MSEVEPVEGYDPDTYDAPNQQVVRPDGSGPADEGEGGTSTEPEGNPLDAMTKEEMLEEAKRLEVSPANASMTKDELRAGIDAKLGKAEDD